MGFFNAFRPARPTPRTTTAQDRQMSQLVGGSNEVVRIQGLMQQRATRFKPVTKVVNKIYKVK